MGSRPGPLRIQLLVSDQAVKAGSLPESHVWSDGNTETHRRMSCSWLPLELLRFQLATQSSHSGSVGGEVEQNLCLAPDASPCVVTASCSPHWDGLSWGP